MNGTVAWHIGNKNAAHIGEDVGEKSTVSHRFAFSSQKCIARRLVDHMVDGDHTTVPQKTGGYADDNFPPLPRAKHVGNRTAQLRDLIDHRAVGDSI